MASEDLLAMIAAGGGDISGGSGGLLSDAATATEGMVPQNKQPLTSFQPTPLQAPPAMPKLAIPPIQFAKAGNEFQTVSGRKRADRQAIISNTANIVKAGSDYVVAKKQRDLSMKIERVFGAMQGLDEAKAAGDQAAIQKNSAILNDLMSDPKTVKQFQKAFNIDLFGTSNGKNKNEQQALQNAYKNFQQEKQKDPNALNPAAQRLMASQPVRQQLSPEAQAQAMAIQAGLLPKAGEILKANVENFKALQTAKTAEERNAVLDKIAQARVEATKYHADKIFDAMIQRNTNAADIARIRSTTEMYKADSVARTWEARLGAMKDVAQIKVDGSPFNKLYKTAQSYTAQLKQLAQDNQKMQAELDKPRPGIMGKYFGMKAPETNESIQMKTNIQINILKMNQMQMQLGGVMKQMQTLDSISGGAAQGLMQEDQSSGAPSGGEDSTGVQDVPDSEMQEPQ